MVRKRKVLEDVKDFIVGLGVILGALFCLAVGAMLFGIIFLLFHLAIPVVIVLLVVAIVCLMVIAVCLVIKSIGAGVRESRRRKKKGIN